MVKLKGTELDSKDLYVYNLSDRILKSLQLCYFDSLTMEQVPEEEALKNQPDSTKLVLTSMPTIVRPRQRSSVAKKDTAVSEDKDLQKYNLKRKQRGLAPMDEIEFSKIMDQLSLSGSESSSDEEEEDASSNLPTISEYTLATTSNSGSKDDEDESFVSFLNTKSALILFKSTLLPKDLCLGVYKSTINATKPTDKPYDLLQNLVKQSSDDKVSALFMIGGGHFAGAIISHKRNSTKGNQGTEEELLLQSVSLVEHRTFHRYTTRRKQGGSQSAMDAAKGKANSAGSTLRRYNEQALEDDVRKLLNSWKPLLDQCESIFIKASGPSSQKVLLTSNNSSGVSNPSPIHASDPRVKYFPFTTKRPTTNEIKRAWCELSYLKLTEVPKENKELKLRQQRKKEALAKSKQQAIQTNNTPVKSQSDTHTDQLIQLLKKSKAPALLSYIKKNKIDSNFQFTPEQDHANAPTMLHFAALSGLNHMCSILLTNLKVNPTLLNRNGKTAYELASNNATKYAFQIARHTLEESTSEFDWVKDARVSESRSKEEVEKINKAETSAEDEEQKRILAQGLQSVKEEMAQDRDKKYGQGKTMRAPGLNFGSETANLSALTDAQRLQVMREQRARAAEERLKKMAGK